MGSARIRKSAETRASISLTRLAEAGRFHTPALGFHSCCSRGRLEDVWPSIRPSVSLGTLPLFSLDRRDPSPETSRLTPGFCPSMLAKAESPQKGPRAMKSCFVIMPITVPDRLLSDYDDDRDHFRHVLDHLFTPALKEEYDVIPPGVKSADVIQAEIIRNLETADLVLCDITSLNPKRFLRAGLQDGSEQAGLLREG